MLLNNANTMTEWVVANKDKVRTAFKWLGSNSKGPICETLFPTRIKNDKLFGDICVYKSVIGPCIVWPKNILQEHKSILKSFRNLSSDLFPENSSEAIPHSLLLERMVAILGLVPASEEFKVERILCSSMVKRYDLGFVVDRYALTEELKARGYNATFDNVFNSSVIVHITSKKEFDASKLRRKKSNGLEKYIFNPGGVVEHHGCVDYMMEDTYNDLIVGTVLSLRDKIALS